MVSDKLTGGIVEGRTSPQATLPIALLFYLSYIS